MALLLKCWKGQLRSGDRDEISDLYFSNAATRTSRSSQVMQVVRLLKRTADENKTSKLCRPGVVVYIPRRSTFCWSQALPQKIG